MITKLFTGLCVACLVTFSVAQEPTPAPPPQTPSVVETFQDRISHLTDAEHYKNWKGKYKTFVELSDLQKEIFYSVQAEKIMGELGRLIQSLNYSMYYMRQQPGAPIVDPGKTITTLNSLTELRKQLAAQHLSLVDQIIEKHKGEDIAVEFGLYQRRLKNNYTSAKLIKEAQ